MYKNVIIAATLKDQELLNIKDFLFDGCTGIKVTEHTARNENQNLRNWVRVLAKSHLLVTYGSWTEDKQLNLLVEIARKINVEVIPHTNFQKYVEQQNN